MYKYLLFYSNYLHTELLDFGQIERKNRAIILTIFPIFVFLG